MKSLKYSAGAVSKGFWFQEFKRYNELLENGFNDKKIKNMQKDENILMAPSEAYGTKMINEVSKRTEALPEDIRSMLLNLSISNQKILNLLGIMMTDRLFFEFMYEVYREKILIGKLEFDNSDTRLFFEDKSEQSDKVAGFKSNTKKRLVGVYGTYLRESNLMEKNNQSLILKKPILDIELEEEMKDRDLYPYLRVFLGE